MNQYLDKQKKFWNKEIKNFDAIYSHSKSGLNNWLDATFRWDMYARFEYTMKNAIPIQGRSFLDVGCGAGHYSLEFGSQGAQKVIGIDISEKMIEICHQRASKLQLNNRCRFLQTDLLEYQPDIKFDVCIGIGLFDYIPEPLPVLTKMGEVVQDRIIISLPRFWTWRALVRKFRLTIKGCDVFFYTKEQIDRLLKQAAFKRYTIEEIGQLYCITAYV